MKLFSRIGQEIRNASYALQVAFARLPPVVLHDVPYVCQFSTPEHAESTLRGTLQTLDDPEWAKSGARSPEEYARWAFTCCGMACTAMALRYFSGAASSRTLPHLPEGRTEVGWEEEGGGGVRKEWSPFALAEDAFRSHVYLEKDGELSGMRYCEYAKWVPAHGLRARVYSRLSTKGIAYALARGRLVIVSVNPNIRGYETAPALQVGGHLVLVTGYDRDKGTVTLNNPSGFASTKTQKGHTLALGEFKTYYAGRAIVLSKI